MCSRTTCACARRTGLLDPRIVIVDIDEKSVDQVGRWPWSRDVIARLIDKLNDKYFVKSVGLDVIFPEPDTSSGYHTLEALAGKELKDVAGIGDRVRALKSQFDYDRRMAESLRERPTVLGYCCPTRRMPLSRACCHRPYSLPPTWVELTSTRSCTVPTPAT